MSLVGVLHVPINIPALGLTTGEDNVDVDRELRAHGWSNALSGLCGSIQVSLAFLILYSREKAAAADVSKIPAYMSEILNDTLSTRLMNDGLISCT